MTRSLVISDLHISSGPLDDCDREVEGQFVRFLQRIDDATELIINGDFLDFVQAEPWSGPELESETSDGVPLCFTEAQSMSKLAAIVTAHEAVFDALAKVLSRPTNRLLILPGNHDPDFFWPGIQSALKARLGCGKAASPEQVVFHLEPHYVPDAYRTVWIEHGHQHDAVNAFVDRGQPRWSSEFPPISVDRNGTRRLFECIGTRFLIKYLNRLDAAYPFVDNVKPFSRFLELFGVAAVTTASGPLEAALAVWAMLRFLAGRVASKPGDLLIVEPAAVPTPSARLKHALETAPARRRHAFAQRLIGAGFATPGWDLAMMLENDRVAMPLLQFLAEHQEIVELLEPASGSLLGLRPGTLQLARGFCADETSNLIDAARAIAQNGFETVVMGHTHETVVDRSDATYFNTGCWTRSYDFTRRPHVESWRVLRGDHVSAFPYRLQYVELQPDRVPCLHTFAEA